MKKYFITLVLCSLIIYVVYLYVGILIARNSPPVHTPTIGTQIPPAVLASHHYATTTLSINKNKVVTFLAMSPAERELGLGGRKGLATSTGMLFVFEQSGDYGFWMKDMQFAIDIVWINEKKQIIHIESDISSDSYPQIFHSPSPARYVLELPAGFVLQHKIANGDYVLF